MKIAVYKPNLNSFRLFRHPLPATRHPLPVLTFSIFVSRHQQLVTSYQLCFSTFTLLICYKFAIHAFTESINPKNAYYLINNQ